MTQEAVLALGGHVRSGPALELAHPESRQCPKSAEGNTGGHRALQGGSIGTLSTSNKVRKYGGKVKSIRTPWNGKIRNKTCLSL